MQNLRVVLEVRMFKVILKIALF